MKKVSTNPYFFTIISSRVVFYIKRPFITIIPERYLYRTKVLEGEIGSNCLLTDTG